MSRVRVAILGSTGSIGRQAIDVAARHRDRVEVVALAAHSNVDMLLDQAASLGVEALALGDVAAAAHASQRLGTRVPGGPEAVAKMAREAEADIVLNAVVGAAGLRASVAALEAGKTLALANKESLVVGGELVTALGLDRIVPVDSEHSAVYQCLLGEPRTAATRLWLTASGGPFRGMTLEQLERVTVEAALAHPRWTMGPKITIDSATLMNKGLEAIEAHHLFGFSFDEIRIVIHPQSCIHSMVEYADGTVKAHLGATDMRIPIQYAFSCPDRWASPVAPVDFAALGRLEFEDPDIETFRCLSLAMEAGRTGGTMPAALNAANEVAVEAFLDKRIGFADIARVVEAVMLAHETQPLESLEVVESVDRWARDEAQRSIA